MVGIIDAILTERQKETTLGIIDVLRKADMMTEALEVISRRFSLQPKAIADWYYSQGS